MWLNQYLITIPDKLVYLLFPSCQSAGWYSRPSVQANVIAPSNAANLFSKGCVVYHHVYVINHVKDLQIFLVWLGHHIHVEDFCVSLHVQNRDVNMIKSHYNWWIHVPITTCTFCFSSWLYIYRESIKLHLPLPSGLLLLGHRVGVCWSNCNMFHDGVWRSS